MKALVKRILLWIIVTASLAIGPAAAMTTTLYFIHTDPAGSIIGRTNAAGNVNWRETYTPYGERVVDSAGAVNNRLFFHGKAFDPDTELVYFGARYYDPFVGRFMGMDAPGSMKETCIASICMRMGTIIHTSS